MDEMAYRKGYNDGMEDARRILLQVICDRGLTKASKLRYTTNEAKHIAQDAHGLDDQGRDSHFRTNRGPGGEPGLGQP